MFDYLLDFDPVLFKIIEINVECNFARTRFDNKLCTLDEHHSLF